MKISTKNWRYIWTIFTITLALGCIGLLWRYYMISPWTRDGRIRANVVKVAPEVSGTVMDVRVVDNQFIHKGDALFVLDEARFRFALAEAEALLKLRKEDLDVKKDHDMRRAILSDLAVSVDEKRSVHAEAMIAQASYDQALAQYNTALLNMERTVVRSPVNGYVTNLNLRAGSYANASVSQLSIVDSDSFYILGYFEETKLSHIHQNNLARIELMGFGASIKGHVESVSRGITDQNDRTDEKGLANVDPVFTWVRLAQRIPVHIRIDEIPAGVMVSAGMTCTIHVDEGSFFAPIAVKP